MWSFSRTAVFASAGVDGTVKIWEADTGHLLRTLTGDEETAAGFTGLAISPDGTRLAAGGMDGTITIWDSSTGNVIMTLNGHARMVTGLSFSPDGIRLATASWDGTAKVWDLSKGKRSLHSSAILQPGL